MAKNDTNFNLHDPAFASDRFRIYEFKIKRCPKAKPHDWTQCPFAHPGEKAKRRDPRRFNYSGNACPDYRKAAACPRGDNCPFAHGVFETWLHPERYKTQMCIDGGDCQRNVCFFAHSETELRMPPPGANRNANGAAADGLHQQQLLLQHLAALAAQQVTQPGMEALQLLANQSALTSLLNQAGSPMQQQALQQALLSPQDASLLLANAMAQAGSLQGLLRGPLDPEQSLAAALLQQQQQHQVQAAAAAAATSVLSNLSRTTSMASGSRAGDGRQQEGMLRRELLMRQDSLMSLPNGIGNSTGSLPGSQGFQPGSLGGVRPVTRQLSLDTRNLPSWMSQAAPDSPTSLQGANNLDPSLAAMLHSMSINGGGSAAGSLTGAMGGPLGTSPGPGTQLGSVSELGADSNSPMASVGVPQNAEDVQQPFVLPADYQLTSRSTVDNGVLQHMRELAQLELAGLSELELDQLQVFTQAIGAAQGGKNGPSEGPLLEVLRMGSNGPSGPLNGPSQPVGPSSSEALSPHSDAGLSATLSADGTLAGGAPIGSLGSGFLAANGGPHAMSESGTAVTGRSSALNGSLDGAVNGAAVKVNGAVNSSAAVHLVAYGEGDLEAAVVPVAAHGSIKHGLQQTHAVPINRNFSIDRLLDELPRSLEQMAVSTLAHGAGQLQLETHQ